VSRGSDSRAAWWATVAWKRQSRTTEGHHLPALHANHHVALRFARQPGGNVRELARDVGVVDIVGRAVCHEDDRRHPRACYRDETRSGNREKIARSFEVASNLRDDNGNAFRGREVLSLSLDDNNPLGSVSQSTACGTDSLEHQELAPLAVGEHAGHERNRTGGTRRHDRYEPRVRALGALFRVGRQGYVHGKETCDSRDQGHARRERRQHDIQPDELVAMTVELDVDKVFRVVDILGQRLHPGDRANRTAACVSVGRLRS